MGGAMQQTAKSPQWLASLGAALEYADFVIFVLQARFLGPAFFPASSAWAQAVQPIGLFAAGYIARPLGGLVFGSRGDRCGRKSTFVRTTNLMAVATLGIGCLPTYVQIGPAAPCLLVLLRCLQGFAMGGELPGALTFVAEHAAPARRGRACAAVIASVSLGGLLAGSLLAALTAGLGTDRMAAWGWRLPFWLGDSLALLSRIMRSRLQEPAAYLLGARSPRPVRTMLGEHAPRVAAGIGVAALGASATVFPLYAPVYLNRLGYEMESIYRAITLGLAWAVVICLASGWLIDRLGARRFLCTAAALWAAAVPTALAQVQRGTPAALALFCLLWQTGTSALNTGYWTVLAGAFPARVRYSALALCSNLSFACSGMLPILLERLSPHGPAAMSLPYVLLAGLGGMSALALRLQARPEDV